MVVALVVAGGKSARFNSEVPKQFIDLNGISIIERSVMAFLNTPEISAVYCVIPHGFEDAYQKSFSNVTAPKFFYGGASRQESVFKGLQALQEYSPSQVLIHDAARPLVSPRIICDVIRALAHYRAVDVGIEVTDTIKKKAIPIEVLNRDELYATQTPQGFDYQFILNAHSQHIANYNDNIYSDDISLAIIAKEPAYLVRGEKINLKITTQEDIELAKLYIGKYV